MPNPRTGTMTKVMVTPGPMDSEVVAVELPRAAVEGVGETAEEVTMDTDGVTVLQNKNYDLRTAEILN